MATPTGEKTMHIAHMGCPAIETPYQRVTAVCGAETDWADEDALKCPICCDLMFKPMTCPMCGAVMDVMIDS